MFILSVVRLNKCQGLSIKLRDPILLSYAQHESAQMSILQNSNAVI